VRSQPGPKDDDNNVTRRRLAAETVYRLLRCQLRRHWYRCGWIVPAHDLERNLAPKGRILLELAIEKFTHSRALLADIAR
jgi:hypothetical protein